MKQKINLQLALIALIAVIATTLSITMAYYNLFERQVRDDLRTNAELLDDTGYFQKLYLDDTIESLDSFEGLEDGNLRITWIDNDGTVLYDNDADVATLPNHSDRPEIQEAFANGSGECVRRSSTLNMNTFYYALLLDDGTVLRVATEARSITSVFLTAIPLIAAIVVVIILICIWLSHLLTKQLLVPIEEMAENLDEGVSVPTYKELVPFADKIRSQHENILSAAKSRQDFTANITHELKTPLTAISGYAELIENRMVDPQQEIHFAQSIRENASRLLSLINDIIRLSELDHTEIPHQYASVDLYQMAKDCCENLQVNAGNKGVRLTFEGEQLSVSGERELLTELLINLIQNAIQYNRENGTVKVSVKRVNGDICMIVADTGIGIPKEAQSRVFERFYRVDKSRSRATGGTGLGLAIVKHIAEIHDAKIELTSEVGKGTTVRVIF